MRPTFVACAVLLLSACAGSSPPTTVQTPTGYSGTYATGVALVSNACDNVTVQNNPTTVSHTESTGALSLSHAGIQYTGTMAADRSFTTTPKNVDVGDGFTYVITIAGQFTSFRAFTADATVDRTGGGTTCRFVVRWAGTR